MRKLGDEGKGEGHDEGKDKEHDLPKAPPKRQRIPRARLLQIEDTDWGTSQSRLRHQLQDYSPLYPEGLSSESSDSRDEEGEETTELSPGGSLNLAAEELPRDSIWNFHVWNEVLT